MHHTLFFAIADISHRKLMLQIPTSRRCGSDFFERKEEEERLAA